MTAFRLRADRMQYPVASVEAGVSPAAVNFRREVP